MNQGFRSKMNSQECTNMFTGIIQGTASVTALEKKPGMISFSTPVPSINEGATIGSSVAIDGVCLTVTKIEGSTLSFDVMEETLNKTTLASLEIGSQVNVETSATIGQEIGGHLMSGHIFGTAEIIRVEKTENNHTVTFQAPKEWMKYILPKGFIGLDGASLTVVDPNPEEGTFQVWLIPETLRMTSFGWKKEGDRVNVEIDSRTQAIVDTVEEYLKTK